MRYWAGLFSSVAIASIAIAHATGREISASSRVSKPGEYKGYSAPRFDGYRLTSFYVPARDGTKLAVDLFRPTLHGEVTSERLPVIWMNTPYNRRNFQGKLTVQSYPGYALGLVKYGYNVAVVDYRGLYASYGKNYAYNVGQFVGPAVTDAYDVTEWFARQPWATKRVGMWGCSATGGSQVQAATTRPPSLKAIMPMSPSFDAYTFGVLGGVAPPGPIVGTGHPTEGSNPNAARDAQAVAIDGPDGKRELAEAIAQHIDNTDSVGVVPFRDSRSAPLGGIRWWQVSSPSTKLAELQNADIGVYAVATWDELATKPAAFWLFGNLPAGRAKFLVGPKTHCAWDDVERDEGFSIVPEELRFFDYWLKGIQNGIMKEPAVTYFTYNAPAATKWRTSATWPLAVEHQTPYYLGAHSLGVSPSAAGEEAAGLSPALPDRVLDTTPLVGGLTYETQPLARNLEVTGHPQLRLWIKTANEDVDVVARIEDVAPDGSSRTYQMMGRLRASGRALAKAPYRNFGLPWHSFFSSDARPIPAGKPTELRFDILPMSYIYPAGHRIRLHIIFSDPQRRNGRPDVAVLHGPANASALILPVIPQ
jgi:predicted acyl esterase